MAISSDTLFHFTPKRENIISILERTFFPRFCFESVMKDPIGIPMVCFCDIPLSQIRSHTELYGNYAVGLKKSWAIEKGLNPVFYYSETSHIKQTLDKMRQYLNAIHKRGFENFEDDIAKSLGFSIKKYFELVCFTKPIVGSNWDWNIRDFKPEKRNLYNEREWRYMPPVPDKLKNGSVIPDVFINKATFLNDTLRNEANKSYEKYALSFEPDNIDYIAVSDENEIVPMYNDIGRIKSHFNDDKIKRLQTKIIHIDRIKNDA